MIPTPYKAKLEQLRQEAAMRAQLMQQYQADMAGRYTKDMIPFAQWMSQRQQGQAKGGAVNENLKKFLADSTVKKRLYHGTTAHDEYSDEEGQAFKQFTGRPTWLAEKPYTASGYSKGTGSTYPVYAQLKNPLKLNFDANDDAEKAFPLARKLGVDINHIVATQKPEKAWEVINHPSFIDAIENAGHDGILINEGGYKTHGVLDPRKIKSAIGNRGTYDPKSPDITKAEGGRVTHAHHLEIEERPL